MNPEATLCLLATSVDCCGFRDLGTTFVNFT